MSTGTKELHTIIPIPAKRCTVSTGKHAPTMAARLIIQLSKKKQNLIKHSHLENKNVTCFDKRGTLLLAQNKYIGHISL